MILFILKFSFYMFSTRFQTAFLVVYLLHIFFSMLLVTLPHQSYQSSRSIFSFRSFSFMFQDFKSDMTFSVRRRWCYYKAPSGCSPVEVWKSTHGMPSVALRRNMPSFPDCRSLTSVCSKKGKGYSPAQNYSNQEHG